MTARGNHAGVWYLVQALLSAPFLILGCASDAPHGEEADGMHSAVPEARISNGELTLHIYLPDAERGFYRGKRFDWSGMIHRAEWAGHTFFGPWADTRDPEGHDHNSVGPCEEFGMGGPLGYAEAKPGETFVKIGVGHLARIDDKDYSFDGEYRLVRPGEWTVHREADRITFEQRLDDERGWGYRYEKTIRLEPGAPAFVIEHELENTGRRAIDTDFYNHNFTSIDEQSVGTGYRMTFSFPAKPRRPLLGLAEMQDASMVFVKDVDRYLFTEIDGLEEKAEDSVFVIENVDTGAGLRVSGDRAPFKVNFFAAPRAVCPEGFLRLRAEPRESVRWEIRYQFFSKHMKARKGK